MIKKIFILIGLVSTIILASCSASYKLGGQYYQRVQDASLLLLQPEFLYLNNLKDVDSTLSELEQDSLRYFESDFIQNISDTTFINTYVEAYVDMIKDYGFSIYRGIEMEEFMEVDSLAYVVNIAQIELEEYFYDFRDEEYINGLLYYKEVDLNALNVNSWFEISQVNDEKAQLLFANHFITDEYFSQFKEYPFSDRVEYDYEVDSLDMDKIDEFAQWLGKLYATYTYDYLMNRYIQKNLPPDQKVGWYRFDPYRKTMYLETEDRFEFLDQ